MKALLGFILPLSGLLMPRLKPRGVRKVASRGTSHWPLTIFNTVVALLQLFLPLVLVRIFSRDDIGVYKIFFLYLNILPLLAWSAGFTHGLPFWTGNRERGALLVSQVWTLILIYSGILMFAGFAGAPLFSGLFDNSLGQAQVFVLAGGLLLINNFYEESWIAKGRIWQAATFRGITEILRTAAVLYVAWVSRDVQQVFVAHTVVMFAKCAIAGTISLLQQSIKLIFNRALIKEIFRYAVPVSTAGFLSAFANYADQMLMSRVLSNAQFAVFAMGCLSLPPIAALEISVNQVLAAKLSQCLGGGNKKEAEAHYAEAVTELARFAIPCCIGLFIFAEPIVKILYTSTYIESAPILRFYSLGYLLLSIPYDGGPRASGHGAWAFKVFVLKTIISVVLVLTLARYYGPYGAIGGVLTSGIFLRVAGLVFNVKVLNWSFAEFFPTKQLIRIASIALLIRIASIALLLGAGCVLSRGLFIDERIWFFVTGGTFFVIYGALILRPGRMAMLRDA